MITLEDCVAFCGLTEEEVLAIAEHEHMPEIAAAAFADYLTNQEHGTEKIRDMIVDDIRAAQARNDKEHVVTLLHVLHHFLKTHPEARPEQLRLRREPTMRSPSVQRTLRLIRLLGPVLLPIVRHSMLPRVAGGDVSEACWQLSRRLIESTCLFLGSVWHVRCAGVVF
jgi:hypothetical protein